MYTREKFQKLSTYRQAEIIWHELSIIERQWEAEPSLTSLNNYFNWLNSSSPLYRLENLVKQLSHQSTLRELLNILVPVERYLDKSLKDNDFIIRTNDNLEQSKKTLPIYLVLDHLRSSFNVGSIFRTAECLGVKHIFLVGYTPSPENDGVKKTAMGTEEWISWSHHNNIEEVVDRLKQENISIVGLETCSRAQPLRTFRCPENVALVLGNERFGLMENTLVQCNHLVEIEMLGYKNSLNVANALSITLYEFSNQMLESR
ncbi:MAG: RNA methyltransferase [Bdellovibrionales bacterium]|nr:RNA methyltransferase [Bdellovibrionales bacterium]